MSVILANLYRYCSKMLPTFKDEAVTTRWQPWIITDNATYVQRGGTENPGFCY